MSGIFHVVGHKRKLKNSDLKRDIRQEELAWLVGPVSLYLPIQMVIGLAFFDSLINLRGLVWWHLYQFNHSFSISEAAAKIAIELSLFKLEGIR